MLRAALDAEAGAFVERHALVRDEAGRRQVVRNGHLPERSVLTGAGELAVKQPRVRDRRGAASADAVRFESKILPPYLRRSKSIDELIPWLYLRGVSTGDMLPALEALVGEEAKGLSASVVTRLTTRWRDEHQEWCKRDLAGKEYVYIWADGVHFNIRLEENRQCILVVIGATKDGDKEVIAIQDGYRESTQDWRELFLDLKSRGLAVPPKIAVGDGALGFWNALEEIFPTTQQQPCWIHKTANVLNKMPKKVQSRAKDDLHQIWMADTREAAHKAFDLFLTKHEAKYPKAAACLVKDRDELLNGEVGSCLCGEVVVRVGARLKLSMSSPPAGPVPAPFALYAWPGAASETTVSPQPFGLGSMCFPTFLTVGVPKPIKVWNNAGHENLLGTPDFASQPAPSVLLSRANGWHRGITVTLQGFIADNGSAADVPGSITNAITLNVIE